MLDRILAPVDDPAQTRVAIDLALALAAPLGATVTLFHVVDPAASGGAESEDERRRTDTGLVARPLDPLASTGNPQIEEDATAVQPPSGRASADLGSLRAEAMPDEEADAARHVLERIAAENNAGDVPVAVAIGEGKPPDAILSMAHMAPFDLIVMETRRSSTVARMVMGSTADEVARNAQVPVVLINPQATGEHAAPVRAPQNIIVPLDGSPGAAHVIPLAQELAKRLSANLIFLQAQSEAPEAASAGRAGSRQRGERRGEGPGNGFAAASRSKGVRASVEVMEGDPLSAITGLVESLERPMVVIDASAKSGLHRLLTGSLPDKVVRGSGVPVLLAPEKLGPAIH